MLVEPSAGKTTRRRYTRCLHCGGQHLVRGKRVPGLDAAIEIGMGGEKHAPVYSYVCTDCGLVTLFTRRENLKYADTE